MATVLVSDIITRAQVNLQDATTPGIRWPTVELERWVNDAHKEIVNARPDANTVVGTHACASGIRQSVSSSFASALRLMDVVYNKSTGTSMIQIDRSELDDQRRSWPSESATTAVSHFMTDERDPRSFLVYPPAQAGTQLEVLYSATPAAVTGSNPINVPDGFANAILDYVLYRAYQKDAEYAGNAERAMMYYQAFMNGIGKKTEADVATVPTDKHTLVRQPT